MKNNSQPALLVAWLIVGVMWAPDANAAGGCTNVWRVKQVNGWLFTVGMTKKNSPLSEQEKHFLQLLRKNPEMMERFRSILELATDTDGRLKSADEVEALLIDEVRRLGKTAMGNWALTAERRLGDELAKQDATASVRKKKR